MVLRRLQKLKFYKQKLLQELPSEVYSHLKPAYKPKRFSNSYMRHSSTWPVGPWRGPHLRKPHVQICRQRGINRIQVESRIKMPKDIDV